MRSLNRFSLLVISLLLPVTSAAFDLDSPPGNRFTMNLDLLPTSPFATVGYGYQSWNSLAQSALATWNQIGVGTGLDYQFFTYTQSSILGDPCYRLGVNEVRWASTYCGMSFGDAIAVTLQYMIGGKRVEAHTLFNNTLSWNAYPGPLRQAMGGGVLNDFVRVAVHEFGHIVGLDHPDEAGQVVQAIMNTCISDTYTLQSDDILGAHAVAWPQRPQLGSPADFNADRKPDILWRSQSSGDVTVWYLNGVSFTGWDYVGIRDVPLDWQPVGIADLNGDGHPDLLWWNHATGDVTVWYLNGTTFTDWDYVARGVPLDWQPVGIADLNGDGKPDLLWRSQSSGDVTVWYLNGATFASWAYVALRGVPSDWQLVGSGDFNGDGHPDLLWWNHTTGDVSVWYLNGVTFTGWAYVGIRNVPLDWQPVGIADLNGDGHPDLLWRSQSSGDVTVWYLNGVSFTGWDYVGIRGVPSDWQVVGPK